MPWTDPIDPISGTGITRAWAITNVTGLLRWLRVITGGADPAAADQVLISTGVSLTHWGTVTDAALADAKVSKTAPPAANLNVPLLTSFYEADSAAGATPFPSYWQVLNLRQNNLAAHHAFQLATDLATNTQYVRQIASGVATGWAKVWTEATDGAGSGLDADTLDGVQLAAMNFVPLGAVVWFRTAAEVTAAGASWAVETNLAGRVPIGAGTTFSQTFVEATSYGSNWTPFVGVSGGNTQPATGGAVSFAGGGTAAVNASHVHEIIMNAQTWLIPSRAGVWARRV